MLFPDLGLGVAVCHGADIAGLSPGVGVGDDCIGGILAAGAGVGCAIGVPCEA
jgi:hypothetical protein